MGIMVNGIMQWQAGDVVFCYFNELSSGQFVILEVLKKDRYRVADLNGRPGTFVIMSDYIRG